MKLLLLHPEVAFRDCGHCQQWLYDEKTGKVTTRRGRPVPRPPGTFAPCRYAKGCPKGTPERPKSLSKKNQMAYRHYLECKATGHFPDDPIVRQNAGTIRMIEDVTEANKQDVLMARLGVLGPYLEAMRSS